VIPHGSPPRTCTATSSATTTRHSLRPARDSRSSLPREGGGGGIVMTGARGHVAPRHAYLRSVPLRIPAPGPLNTWRRGNDWKDPCPCPCIPLFLPPFCQSALSTPRIHAHRDSSRFPAQTRRTSSGYNRHVRVPAELGTPAHYILYRSFPMHGRPSGWTRAAEHRQSLRDVRLTARPAAARRRKGRATIRRTRSYCQRWLSGQRDRAQLG
jgi:hypothetical protein